MTLLRTEHYTDSEGEPVCRQYFQDSYGQHYVSGPGYMLPCDADGAIELPASHEQVRFVNYSMTVEG